MIQWTSSGAVANASSLQIRVTRGHPSRLGVGAPEPSRGLSFDELIENIRYFTVNRRDPRTVPCTGLVLAGSGLLDRGDLSDVIAEARENEIQRIVLHGDWTEFEELARAAVADEVVVTVLKPEDLQGGEISNLLGTSVTVVVALTRHVVSNLDEVIAAALARRPGRVVLTWPFHGEPPPTVEEVLPALKEAQARLERVGIPWGLKNLPPCQLEGEAVLSSRIWRSGNRWYVDADHQTEKALLFFPDVVRFYKGDSCRYCSCDRDCDGVSLHWFRAGLTKPLQPL